MGGNGTGPVEAAHEDGDEDDQPDGPDRSLGVPVDSTEETAVRQTTVSAEGVESSGVRLSGGLDGKEGDQADEWPDDQGAGLAHPVGHDLKERGTAWAREFGQISGTEDHDHVQYPTEHLKEAERNTSGTIRCQVGLLDLHQYR